MSQSVHLRKWGVEAVVNFELYETDGVDLKTDAADGGTDCNIMKDQGAETTCDNDFADEGSGYSITITATEMEAAQITLYIIDSAAKVYLDKVIHIETYGNASAMHAFDLDTASAAQSADNDTKLDTIITGVNVTSEADIDFGAAKKTSLNAATTDLSAITGDKASYKATGFATSAVVGALDNAAAAGAVTEADTLMQYLKQLINILIGGPGVVTFPAEAAPGDGVSLAEVIRAIHVDVTGLNGDVMVGTDGANIVEPDATGVAAALHATTDAKIDTTDGLIGTAQSDLDIITGGSGVFIDTDAVDADAIKTDAVDLIWAKAMTDLATGAPSATASVLTAINVLYEAFRNKTETTATLITIMKDDGTTDLMKSTISDAGGTTTKEEFVSG